MPLFGEPVQQHFAPEHHGSVGTYCVVVGVYTGARRQKSDWHYLHRRFAQDKAAHQRANQTLLLVESPLLVSFGGTAAQRRAYMRFAAEGDELFTGQATANACGVWVKLLLIKPSLKGGFGTVGLPKFGVVGSLDASQL
jgi:hypothetical protein